MLTRKVTHVRFGQKVVFGYCRRHGDICRGQFATPAGYQQPPQHHAASRFTCPSFPAPFTGALDFTSKYEGRTALAPR
jgi:hypothetical protein